MKKQVSMGAVYAPPELMQERTNMMREDEVYPFNQAHINGEAIAESEAEARKSITNEVYASPRILRGLENDQRVMNDVYASPQLLNDFGNDRSNVKRDISAASYENVVKRKVSYCMNCGYRILENVRFCPNCGTPTYRVNERERENITSVLYGPPTVMKKGIVSKIRDLLKRK